MVITLRDLFKLNEYDFWLVTYTNRSFIRNNGSFSNVDTAQEIVDWAKAGMSNSNVIILLQNEQYA